MIDYKKLTKPYEQESIKKLQEWIKINSVYDETTVTKENPFGKGVDNALSYIAKLGEKEGFNIDRCDNYCTEISYGEGDLIAIYAHADVVPVTGKWDEDPFGAVIKDGIMYGRGTSDDKGPGMAAFYALKALKDNNLINGYKVTLVIGGNEERGSQCLEHYFHVLKKPYPKYGFTPDGEFPLIYGEKGICNYVHKLELNNPEIVSLSGGIVSNSVIDEAHVVLKNVDNLETKCKEFFSLTQCKYELKNGIDESELVVYGKSAHGSTPSCGINAGLYLLKFLGITLNNQKLIKLANCYLETSGKEFDCYYETKYLHATTFNVGIMNMEDRVLNVVVNFRFPENVDIKEVEAKLKKMDLGDIEMGEPSEVLLMDPESPFIQTLLSVYQKETGDMETPIMTIGGGTYAKESKNTVAFGSAFPNRNDKIHSPNEEIHIDDFIQSQAIYARAIYELGKLK